jgi:hypothetical protein
MNATTECPGITSTTARRRAIGVLAACAAAGALLALSGTYWSGTPETTVASRPVRLGDQATAAPLRVQDVDDSDQDEAQLQENNAMQTMIQAEQQAQQQNDQAQQQFLQDELQAQQTEQQANQ